MSQKKTNRYPIAVCEKIRNTISASHAIRALRRISHGLQTSNSEPMVKAHVSRTKPVALQQPNQGEVIPIEFDDPPLSHTLHYENEKMAKPHASVQKNGQQVAKISQKIEPSGHPKEDKSKNKVEKASSNSVVVAQIDGQGVKPTSKVQAPKHDVRVQEQHPKPKMETAAAVKVDAAKHDLSQDKKEGKKAGTGDGEDRFSDFINRAKNRMMRTMTNVGEGRTTTTATTITTAPRVDSLNEKVSNYINRAKGKIRTTSNLGDGKSVSFK